ncbi:MAG: hypothetical protein ACO377_11870, partial [Pseudomonadales bacterium]
EDAMFSPVWMPDGPEDYNNALGRGRAFERPVSFEYILPDTNESTQADCGIMVNSSSASAMREVGTGCITASWVGVTGGYSGNCINPTPATGIDAALRTAVDRSVFFEVSLNRNPVYTQAETILTRRLYYSGQAQIYSDLPDAPDLPGAEVYAIGATRSFPSVRDSHRFEVIEQRFAIIPRSPGRLTIPSIALTTSVRLSVNGALRRVGARVSSPTLDLEVLPIPAEWPASQPWLPADAVTLEDRWTPNQSALTVGDPVERELVITVQGNMAAAIPPADDNWQEAALRQYPEPPVLEDDRDGATTLGTRRARYTLLAAAPGTVTVPSPAVHWWDVEAHQARVTSGPTRTITVTKSGTTADTDPRADGSQAMDEPYDRTRAETTAANGASEETRVTADAPSQSAADNAVVPEKWVRTGALGFAGILFLGALVATVTALWRRTAKVRHTTWPAVAANRVRHRLALMRARQRLLRAANRSDLAAMTRELHRYLSLRYGTEVGSPAALFRSEGGGQLMNALSGARFGSPPLAPPTAQAIAEVLSRLPPIDRPKPDPLPPLYPAG